MAKVGGRNTSPERIFRSALWGARLRFRLHRPGLAGRPDIVFEKARVAVFVDGCFWHGCPDHYSRPRSRESFWASKLRENVERDGRQTLALEAAGWRVVRVWEHEVFTRLDELVTLIKNLVNGGPRRYDEDWRVYHVAPAPLSGHDWERRDLCLLRDGGEIRYEVGPRKTGADKMRKQERGLTQGRRS